MAPLKSNFTYSIKSNHYLLGYSKIIQQNVWLIPLDKELLNCIHLELNHDVKIPDIEVLMQIGFLIEKKLKYM